MTCIVAYDIEEDKIRGKLARFLEKRGRRLQKSVFAVEVERHAFSALLRQMEMITGPDNKVAVFKLCVGCSKNAIQMSGEQECYHVF